MAENIMGVLKHEWCSEDIEALANQVKKDESILRLKRRWLMDLPLSEKEQKRIDELLPPKDKMMPESFLREDDVGYEDIKSCVEMAFGARKSLEEPICDKDDVPVLDLFDDFRETSFVLDAMNNKGLYCFAKILTGGLITFDKTNLSMKRAIRELLPKVIAEKNDISKTKLQRCSLLLKDPTNFLGNTRVTVSESYRANALKVLDGLEDFPCRTLRAMSRKLKGVTGYIPSLKPQKSGWSQGQLISIVRKRCTEMLSDIGTGEEPAEPLAGALGVAGLTLKLMMNCPDVTDFRKFSPEIEALHDDIAKAIHLLKEPEAVSLKELKEVQLLLDPNFELPVKSLRMAVRNLLIEYLYECSDMGGLPEFLVETINIINSSHKGFSSPYELMKEEKEKELQQVLNISAQAKEVVANLLPEHEFDEEFALAYVDIYDGSDTVCFFDDDQHGRHGLKFHSCSSYDQTESIEEINPTEFNSPVSRSTRGSCSHLSPMGRSDMNLESMHLNVMNSNGACDSQTSMDSKAPDPAKETTQLRTPLFHSPDRKSSPDELKGKETASCSPAIKVGETDSINQQSRSINKYLELQEACDTTSMTAYRFVGYMLNTLARTEGLELDRGDRLYLTSDSNDTEEFSQASASNFPEMWKKVLESTRPVKSVQSTHDDAKASTSKQSNDWSDA